MRLGHHVNMTTTIVIITFLNKSHGDDSDAHYDEGNVHAHVDDHAFVACVLRLVLPNTVCQASRVFIHPPTLA